MKGTKETIMRQQNNTLVMEERNYDALASVPYDRGVVFIIFTEQDLKSKGTYDTYTLGDFQFLQVIRLEIKVG